MIPPPRQGGGGTKAPALSYVVTCAGLVVNVVVSVAGGFVVKCCLVPAVSLKIPMGCTPEILRIRALKTGQSKSEYHQNVKTNRDARISNKKARGLIRGSGFISAVTPVHFYRLSYGNVVAMLA